LPFSFGRKRYAAFNVPFMYDVQFAAD
jgi:hypothetical protein